MTREEKQKAIDALKKSAPVMAVTQEEFNDYIQTLNKIMDWLEQKPIIDKVRAQIEDLLKGLEMSLAILEKGDKLEPKLKGAIDAVEECINIIDEAKSEAEK